jgi:hypothetical protein
LSGVAGLTQRSTAQGGGKGYGLWSVNGGVGRVMLQDQNGNALPVAYQCGNTPPVPQGSAMVCAQDTTATVTVPSGTPGRTLVLAEDALPGWSASMGDQTLGAAPSTNGLQAWRLPANGGTITIGYHSMKHTVWLIIGGFTAIAATIMALPFGRRPDEEIEGEEAAELDAASEPAAAPEPEQEEARPQESAPRQEPEPYREPEPPYREPDAYPAESEPEPAPAYQAPGYGSGEYPVADASYEQYPMANTDPYADEPYTYQQQGSYEQQPAYEQPYQDGYESVGYGEPERYSQPQYGQSPYDPAQYSQAEHDSGQYQQGQYGESQYGDAQYGEGQYTESHYAQPEYGSGQYPQAQYGEAQYGQADYEQAPYEHGAYGHYGDQYADPAPYQYGVPEPRQADEPAHRQAQHQTTQHQYGNEYDPDGYGQGEQDGWTR